MCVCVCMCMCVYVCMCVYECDVNALNAVDEVEQHVQLLDARGRVHGLDEGRQEVEPAAVLVLAHEAEVTARHVLHLTQEVTRQWSVGTRQWSLVIRHSQWSVVSGEW